MSYGIEQVKPFECFLQSVYMLFFSIFKFWIKSQKSKPMTVLILKLEKPTILFFNRGKIYTEYVILCLNERHV